MARHLTRVRGDVASQTAEKSPAAPAFIIIIIIIIIIVFFLLAYG